MSERRTVSILRAVMIMSDEYAEQLYKSLTEIRDQITLLEKSDILDLDDDEVEELEKTILSMENLFSILNGGY